METNSIRMNMSNDITISSIRLHLSDDIHKDIFHLVVEGDDDCKLLRKFKNNNLVIHQSSSGKTGVLEILQNQAIQDNRVIGIRDRDYCVEKLHNRIFFYDMCCLEMMIIYFDRTFESIYCEFYQGKLSVGELKSVILENLYILSMFRKLNETRNLEINFKGLTISNLLDTDLNMVNNYLVTELIKRSPNCHTSLISLLEEIVNISKSKDIESYLKIVNGHDFITLFKIHCNSNARKGISESQITSTLRGSFNADLFKLTNLFYQTAKHNITTKINLWNCN